MPAPDGLHFSAHIITEALNYYAIYATWDYVEVNYKYLYSNNIVVCNCYIPMQQ